MNYKLLFIFFILFGSKNSSKGQEQYRVIALKNKTTILSSSKELALLDSFKITELIKIQEGAYIAFIDEAVNIFEYYGPKTIKIDTLRGRSKQPIIHRKKKTFNKEKMGAYPDLMMINSEYKRSREPYHDSNFKFQIYYPYPFSNKFVIGRDSILNVKWIDGTYSETSSHNFLLSDEFGDSIENKENPSKIISLNLKNIKNDQTFYFFISRMDDKNKRTNSFSFKISKGLKSHDVTLNEESPAANLMTALFLEKNGLVEEAENHYLKAATSGVGIEFYNETLLKFKKRWGR
jgi:hypothetical protein